MNVNLTFVAHLDPFSSSSSRLLACGLAELSASLYCCYDLVSRFRYKDPAMDA